MARSRKGRRRRTRLIKGTVDVQSTLSTLANNTGILAPSDVVTDRSFVLSCEATYALFAATVGEGPLEIYLAHSDYTLAEIEAFIESATAWSDADEISKEISRRKIRKVGTFSGNFADEVINNGMPVKTKLGFIISEGQGLNLVIYNNSGGALAGGAAVNWQGHCWIKPQ